MKIKIYRSSTVGIFSGGVKILMDPWLTDGEYYGSWFHYPYFKIDNYIDELNSFDAIYISHIHPDHCSEKTLKRLKNDIPIYIHSYHEKFLKFKLERLGFKVIELQNNKRTHIKGNVNINIIAADNCNPSLCYKFFGCKDASNLNGSNQIDTISVIDDGKFSILNINDAPYSLCEESLGEVINQYDKIDLLLTGYTGAGPFPQCVDNFNTEQKKIEAENKKLSFLNQAFKFIKKIKPNYYVPFAGTYVLGGKFTLLNNLRGVSSIDEAYNFIDGLIKADKDLNTKSMKINYETFFDLSLNEHEEPYNPISSKDKEIYIGSLKNEPFDYEVKPLLEDEELIEKSKKAYEKYLNRKLINNFKSDTSIYVQLKDRYIQIDNSKDLLEFPKIGDMDINKKLIMIKTDTRLLSDLLSGPKFAHWNNAEIGSHLRFFRQPNIFERGVYESMSYFHI